MAVNRLTLLLYETDAFKATHGAVQRKNEKPEADSKIRHGKNLENHETD